MADAILIKPNQRIKDITPTVNMVREVGIAPELVQNKGLWMAFVSTPPACASAVHHHGNAESGIYILRGKVRFYFGEKLEQSLDAEEGDFLYVPPNLIHMEENISPRDPVELIVSRNATEMLVVNVPDPRQS